MSIHVPCHGEGKITSPRTVLLRPRAARVPRPIAVLILTPQLRSASQIGEHPHDVAIFGRRIMVVLEKSGRKIFIIYLQIQWLISPKWFSKFFLCLIIPNGFSMSWKKKHVDECRWCFFSRNPSTPPSAVGKSREARPMFTAISALFDVFFRCFSSHCRGYIQPVEVITIFIPFYTPKQ